MLSQSWVEINSTHVPAPFLRRPHPPLAALRAFEAVARLGSLSRAAVELNVTKSAISHQLRALEADLGVVLLNRGGGLRQAELTGAGADLLGSVQQALALLATACRNTRAAAQGGGASA